MSEKKNNIFIRAIKWWLRLLLPDSIESPTLQGDNFKPEDYRDEVKNPTSAEERATSTGVR